MADTIMQVMTDNHKHCDDLFSKLDYLVINRNWQHARSHAACMINDIQYHFKHEEEVLFPAFEIATNNTTGPTMMMRHEHKQMNELLADIELTINNENYERYTGLSETFNILIQQHNIKEEGILYPMIDDACAENRHQLIQSMLNRSPNKVAC